MDAFREMMRGVGQGRMGEGRERRRNEERVEGQERIDKN